MKSFSEIIEELPEDEREIVLKEARQSAKTQQKKIIQFQQEQYEREHHLKKVFMRKK